MTNDFGAVANAAFRYSSSFVDELWRTGVDHAVLCPGSRSTPLALAFAHHPRVTTWPLVDERSAAYFALGMAKALRAPVAILCSSGTATANFFPAVVEAKYGRSPLIVLTADRPHELRDTGALQTIDQTNLYGRHVKWFVDAALPRSDRDQTAYIRSIAQKTTAIAMTSPIGPAHVNFPFEEPLVPDAALLDEPVPSADRHVHERARRRLSSATVADIGAAVLGERRGLIVCGPIDDPEFTDAITRFARCAGYPILADPLSQLRAGGHDQSMVIDNYDAFLRVPDVAVRLRPRLVFRFGMTPISKPLSNFVRDSGATQFGVDNTASGNDPERKTSQYFDIDPAWFAADVAAVLPPAVPTGDWMATWQSVRDACGRGASKALTCFPGMTESGLIGRLAGLLSADAIVFIAPSMPIRDLDTFLPNRPEPLRILANRGVNGIDGVVSSALGAAAALGQRVVLVIGDLCFYHDLNGLLAAKLYGIDATVILMNNDGGGIFSFLPQAALGDVFERVFATPTGLDFWPVVEMYGGHLRRPTDWSEFDASVAESFHTPGLTVIEVRLDREENRTQHAEIWKAVQLALAARSPGL